jgi:hypothetical protein
MTRKEKGSSGNRTPKVTTENERLINRSHVESKDHAAVDFLERLRSGGPWVLTAIVPDGRTNTITARTPEEVLAFVAKYDGEQNLYYSVNPTRGEMTKKAKKTDIARIEYLLADLDPNKDEKSEDAKKRYRDALETCKPPPTAVIDSGNGIQVLWKLSEAIPLDGNDDVAKIADAEARSGEMMRRLGCEDTSTRNIDRILRLPGTTNLPNAKKKKAGRIECPTAQLLFDGVVHPMGDFPAPEAKPKSERKASKTGNKKPLPNNLITMLLIEGDGAYESRSDALFFFINEAIRKCVSDDDIIDALLSEDYKGKGIYEHCIENGGEEYVKRQIVHALNDGDPPASDDQKRTIRIYGGDRHILVDRTEKALTATKCPVFQRGGFLVEPLWTWEKTAEENRDTLVTRFLKLNIARLSYMTAKHAVNFQKPRGENDWIAINPPHDVMEALLELGHWGFPKVKGIVNSPTMRADGSILDEPGYDARTQLWYKPGGDVELPPIPQAPSRKQAEKALETIEDLLSGFPFPDDDEGVSLSVALAGVMTPVLRGAFDHAPGFLFLAPESGTGKTYLVEVISTIATGRAPMAVVGIENKEEMEKRLSAVAFAAMPIVSLNNLDFNLESSLLNQMISEGIVGIRLFGKNDQLISCDCRGTTFFANGNNILVVGDLVRRTLTANIDAKMENPEQREFKFDPVEYVKADRGKYLAAIFTIVRAYMAADDKPTKVKPLAGFNGWSKLVRYPLLWLGKTDVIGTMEAARQNDPVREGLRTRVNELLDIFGTEEVFSAVDVYNKTEERIQTGAANSYQQIFRYPTLSDAFTSGRNRNARTIGNQITKDLKRPAGGYRIERVKDSSKGNLYRLIGAPRSPKKEEM